MKPIPAGLLSRGYFCSHNRVTLLVLGRGGVSEGGELSSYAKFRVRSALKLAKKLKDWGLDVLIIWSGGRSRVQVAKSITLKLSEGDAMLAYAKSLPDYADLVNQIAETISISTVENFVNSMDLLYGTVLVVLSDELHYKWYRIRFIAWKTAPMTKRVYATIATDRGSDFKSELNQMVSTVVTVLAMFWIPGGSLRTIMRVQRWIEGLAGVRKF